MTTPQYGWDTDFYSPAKNSRKGHIVKFQNSEHTSHLLGTFHFVEYLQIYKWWVGGWGPTMGELKHGWRWSPVSVWRWNPLMSVCQTIDHFRQQYMKLQNTKKLFKWKITENETSIWTVRAPYELALFVKLLTSSDKKCMKLQNTNKFNIQKGKTEKKTQIWTESGPHVCVTIDHFRQLRAHPPPDFRDWLCVPTRCVYPRTTRKRRRNESKQKSRDIPAICPRIFTGYFSLENDWSLCEDDSVNYVKVISHKPLYLQTLKTGSSALSGFETPCRETYKCHTMPALYFTFISAIACSDV